MSKGWRRLTGNRGREPGPEAVSRLPVVSIFGVPIMLANFRGGTQQLNLDDTE